MGYIMGYGRCHLEWLQCCAILNALFSSAMRGLLGNNLLRSDRSTDITTTIFDQTA